MACTRFSTRSSMSSSTRRMDMAAVTTNGRAQQQEDRAADRGDRAVPGVLRDARQERADRGAELQCRGFQSLGVLPGEDIRQTMLQAAGELLKYDRMKIDGETSPEALKKAMGERLDSWQKAVARYESEPREREVRKEVDLNPKYGEGRRELMALAIAAERKRDTALERYHHYEVASAAFQIGIVLASAAVITGIVLLANAVAGLG